MLHLLTIIGNAQLTDWVHIVAETKTKALSLEDDPLFLLSAKGQQADRRGDLPPPIDGRSDYSPEPSGSDCLDA